mmetsp:Transcript_36720/g.99346  ORF Transcript_36720/g.99346 Transcript_36720/m.99346 type:complete len:230 (+) Transcript_36720:3323-4012(+)
MKRSALLGGSTERGAESRGATSVPSLSASVPSQSGRATPSPGVSTSMLTPSQAGSVVFLVVLRVTCVVMRPIISMRRSTSAAWQSSVMMLSAEKLRHSDRSGVRMQSSSRRATMGSSTPLPLGRRRRRPFFPPSASSSASAFSPLFPSAPSAAASSPSSSSPSLWSSSPERLPFLRPRFCGTSASSSSSTIAGAGGACGVRSSGWLRMRPHAKFRAVFRASCRGRGMAP